MSRRSATVITLSVRIPLPPGQAVKGIIAEMAKSLSNWPMARQIIIKVAKRETVYL